jgi:hypothetical protein
MDRERTVEADEGDRPPAASSLRSPGDPTVRDRIAEAEARVGARDPDERAMSMGELEIVIDDLRSGRTPSILADRESK